MALLANPPTALDALYELRGTSGANVTYIMYGGTDIGSRYRNINYGGTATAANTGILDSGTDISDIFAQKGTVPPDIAWLTTGMGKVRAQNNPGPGWVSVTLNANGTISEAFNLTNQLNTIPANWLVTTGTGDGAKYEIKYTGAGVTTTPAITAGGGFTNMGSGQQFKLTRGADGTSTQTLTVTLRMAGLPLTEVTGVVTLEVFIESGGGPVEN